MSAALSALPCLALPCLPLAIPAASLLRRSGLALPYHLLTPGPGTNQPLRTPAPAAQHDDDNNKSTSALTLHHHRPPPKNPTQPLSPVPCPHPCSRPRVRERESQGLKGSRLVSGLPPENAASQNAPRGARRALFLYCLISLCWCCGCFGRVSAMLAFRSEVEEYEEEEDESAYLAS
ncbi:uncharacterized protein K452DRAFT_312251 [Aplosporella prunicola CBS 121167]|uniref:Uncharacterized protein n=1 Tax=Aplosporella prunicola CBS 121167 TaxID=1176127 RepID=A0A6A6B327_9PEZI|nr:uncharacterized protein K452DRAFT_312251 [Aplosporella prunicola CBS 121167]KAF2137655.1 hypothetical protein K452DRAFT_312251 [Aplosporella prunicola CBS 121167]